MNEMSQGQLGTTALIYAVVIALFVWRMMRPARVSVARIWIRPALLVLFTAAAVWGEQRLNPAPAWEIAAMLAGGAVLGIPLGILRGRHSVVRPAEQPGIFVVHSSPLIVAVWLAAFIARAAVRYALPGASHGVTVWTLALLAFATAAILASAFIIHGKLQDAKAAAPAA